MNRALFVVYNPKGGGGRASRVFQEACLQLEENGFVLELHETERPGHGSDLVRNADLSGFEGILVVGGDGSIHDVVNGMMSRVDGHRLPIGILPAGTGNSFMQDRGCLDPLKAIQRIARFQTSYLDVAEVRVGQRLLYSFNVVGWGLPADINHRAERMRWLGRHRYTAAALIEIMGLKRPQASLCIEGKETLGTLIFAMGCLTRYTGAGMKIAPRAVLDDGLIDLLVVREAGKSELFQVFPKIFSGNHLDHPKLEYLQVKEFAISSKKPGVLNLDGEVFPDRNISVRVLPREIQVLV